MPINDNIPAIFTVADSLAPSALTELQRAEALSALTDVRASTSRFLDAAESVIRDDPGDAVQVHRVAWQGYRLSSTLHTICRAIWAIENDLIARRKLGNPPLGKEETQ